MTKYHNMIGIIKRLSVNVPVRFWGFINHLSNPIWTTKILLYEKPNNESFKNKIENIQ